MNDYQRWILKSMLMLYILENVSLHGYVNAKKKLNQ